MREIKFRIWDRKNNRWFHGSTDKKSRELKTDAINLFGEVIVCGEILRDQNTDKIISITELNDLITVQYTGLKDKNGVEIYEGDVLETPKGTFKVIYFELSFQIRNQDNTLYVENRSIITWLYDCEVIGNIYENPELLGGGK